MKRGRKPGAHYSYRVREELCHRGHYSEHDKCATDKNINTTPHSQFPRSTEASKKRQLVDTRVLVKEVEVVMTG